MEKYDLKEEGRGKKSWRKREKKKKKLPPLSVRVANVYSRSVGPGSE